MADWQSSKPDFVVYVVRPVIVAINKISICWLFVQMMGPAGLLDSRFV